MSLLLDTKCLYAIMLHVVMQLCYDQTTMIIRENILIMSLLLDAKCLYC